MADRRVTGTGKDSNGNITSLCGGWGSVTKATAIVEIERGTNTYYVKDGYGRRADINVVNGPTGKYLRTDPDATCSDNLDNLPDC
jgi:hypothetical protein